MKNTIIAAITAGVVFFGLQFIRDAGEVTPERVEAEIMASLGNDTQRALYATFEEKFPEDYTAFLREMADLVNEGGGMNNVDQTEVFSRSQQFTANLRIENAHFMQQAPYEDIQRIRSSTIAILQDLSGTPEVCAQFAATGGASFTLDQISLLNMDLMADSANATFLAIAAGRDTPVTHSDVSQADIVATLDAWVALPDVPENYHRILTTPDLQDPNYCDANISLETFLFESEDPMVKSVSVYLSLLAAGF